MVINSRAKSRSLILSQVYLIAALLSTYAFHSSAIAYSCDKWFEKLNLKRGSVECVAACTKAADKTADANKEFYCNPYCRGMCVPDKDEAKCKLEPFWASKLNSDTKPFSRLHGDDLRAVETALSRMPKSIRPKNLKTIVKASGPGDITSLSSPATSSDEYLIIFPKGFLNSDQLPRVIFHELSHFMFGREWKNQFSKYREVSGWNSFSEGRAYRDGDFVDPDGKLSADEDFANNIEFFLFESKTLKDKSPKIFEWIKTQLGKSLQIEKGCQNAK